MTLAGLFFSASGPSMPVASRLRDLTTSVCPLAMIGHIRVFVFVLLISLLARGAYCETAAQRGYRHLTERAYLPADFDQETFDQLWQVWPEPLRQQAAKATPRSRRDMAFKRYGLTYRPGDTTGRPLQYVVSASGEWTMNCFACHGGQVNAHSVPGAPNSAYALQTLTSDVRATKLRLGKPLARMEVGSLFMPLGSTNGTTNAVMFGVALMAFRDPELNIMRRRIPPPMIHHDMDAPPWWHFHRKKNLYIDGFAQKGSRPLMQFMLVEQNGPEKFAEWEREFQDVFAYLESLRPPPYDGLIDRALAENGRIAFERVCSECHGTYGLDGGEYPERMVSLAEVGTDPVRLRALNREHRRAYHESWFGKFGETDVVLEPDGYVAPPLDGVWASAPYLHNGSVPTLWHILNPARRPVVWRRSGTQLDPDRVGLQVEELTKVPRSAKSSVDRRAYFDTSRFGKSAAGHLFADELSRDDKLAVLEYLKTL